MSVKPNQIMIGDILTFKDCKNDKEPVIIKIWQINQEREAFAFIDYDESLDEIVIDDEIVGLPITPEILEKNGFIIKKKWAQIGNFGNSPLIMWHFEDDTILHNFKHELEIHQNDTGKVHVKIPCEYVHELQHALRLCGIEKEIVL